MRLIREAMWGVVNGGGGTAGIARLPAQYGQMAGKTGTTQVRRVTREQRERGYNVECRAAGVAAACAVRRLSRRMTIRCSRCRVVVEHGMAGGATAGPIARDIMVEAFQRLGPQRPGQRVAEATR